MIRRQDEDAEFGLKTLAEIVEIDGQEGLSNEEVKQQTSLDYFEFLIGFFRRLKL